MSFDLLTVLRFLIVIFISIDIHEFSHALAATQLGDDLPERQGRLTLNPLAHLDPVGTVMIVMSSLSGVGFGWGRPVQVNPVRLRHGPAVGMGIVAAAGPISNLILASVAALAFHIALAISALSSPLYNLLYTFMVVNVGLALFNMIPLFPLDGFRIALALLRLVRGPTALNISHLLEGTAAYGPMLFLLLILLNNVLPVSIIGLLIGGPTTFILRLLMGSV